MIGLYDYDLQSSTSTTSLIPNLEIMKLSTYYRREENTFCRLIAPDESDLSGYDKIYFYSEIAKQPIVPPQFLRAKNVIFGGATFTKNYIPFDNELIDYTIARPTIYKDYLKEKYQEGIKTKVISQFLDSAYYRMFVGNKMLPIPPVLPKKHVLIYDQNIFQNNWEEILQEISNRKPSTIIPVHPVICKTLTDFFNIRKMPKFWRSSLIALDLNIPLSEVHYMFKAYKNQFLQEVLPTANIVLELGGTFPTKIQYCKDFIYKINLLYSFWCRNIPIKIKYYQPDQGYTNPIANLDQLVDKWTNGDTKDTKTLNERMTIKVSKVMKETFLKEKQLILKTDSSAKTLFDQNYKLLTERRCWRI